MSKTDRKLFISLMLWSLIPSIYLLIRMHIVANTGTDINILGQMEWFDLIDEIITTVLTVPLYFVIKKERTTPQKNMAAFLTASITYLIFTLIIFIYVGSMAKFMHAPNATSYLRLQTWSMWVSFLVNLMIILFTLDGRTKSFRIMLIAKTTLMIMCDLLLIPMFKENGAAYSEILVNSILAIISIGTAYHFGLIRFGKTDSRLWVHEWIRTGSMSAIQIFLDNWIYAVMVVRIVNSVKQSGNYWMANNFIYGWLLIPVFALVEIIRRNNYDELTYQNAWKPSLLIALCWLITMPGWYWFIQEPMAMSNVNTIIKIVFPLSIFYLVSIPSQIIDGWFVSKGKMGYPMMISLIVNLGYYGIVYAMFKHNLFDVSMKFIVVMFGFGMIAHLFLSAIFYLYEKSK
ncbi:hypothetical protein [Limosilactobacillus mucosae]|uniref:Uncharacterized protein n=1 Tax=Limosilactobacillus mucosae TaxID=97478 RepID=A0AAJ1HSL9_LIMMU|nr:hypothetical protein [Limosilactobacillus mucosae]MDC2828501.1 hypothetical protein [Limosilactobacillus mucosae]MDC2834513.1 hypothetical protein [Limosilactobacillus mucosae]